MPVRTLYLDLIGGVAGDMLVGALLDLGLDPEALRGALSSLGVGPFRLVVAPGRKGAIGGTGVRFEVEPGQPERHLSEIRAIVDGASLGPSVRERAMAVFTRLAVAEARVHRVDTAEVHFHEVGALDAILDVAGFVWGLEALGIERIVSSPIPLGRGFTDSMHGRIPLPAPAVLELLKGIPTVGLEVEAELSTPTGVALVTTLADGYGPLPGLLPERVGYGLGARDLPFPNVVRGVIGQSPDPAGPAQRDRVVLLEANLDDLSPQVLGYLTGRLLDEGALDVWLTPVQMKKGRPGLTISVLCPPGRSEELARRVFAETTTLGVRVLPVDRWVLPREAVTIQTPYGPVRGKRAGGVVRPEYDDLVDLARRLALPLKDVMEEVAHCARSQV